jgi:ribosomal protein S18 acetylase RimI-like enzyme
MQSSTDLTIRPLEPDDSPALLVMMRELARLEKQEQFLEATEELVRKNMFGEQPMFSAFIAIVGGEPAGYLTYGEGYTSWGMRKYVKVDDLFVREAFRGRGIARQLMSVIERMVVERGTYARWIVSPENERAIAFYKSLGARYVLKGQCYWHLDESGKITS